MLSCVCMALAGLLLLPLLVNLATACPYFFQDLSFFLRLVQVLQRARLAGTRVPPCTLMEVFCRRAWDTPGKALLLCRDEVFSRAR